MRAFFTCTSVKVSIRDLNTIRYIHIIVFLTSDLDDLIKVPLGAMGYGFGMRGGVNIKGEGEGVRVDSIRESCICKIQLSH